MGFSCFILELRENIRAILFKLTVYHLKLFKTLMLTLTVKKQHDENDVRKKLIMDSVIKMVRNYFTGEGLE